MPCEQVVYLGYLQDLPFKYSFSQQQWYQYQVSSTSLDAPIQMGLSHGSKNPKYQKFIQPIEKEHRIIRREAGVPISFV